MNEVREQILAMLSDGKSMRAICKLDGMPNRETVRLWRKEDEEFDLAITHAREEGFHSLAEKALEDAEAATDAATGRLKFDARRWYVGKLSNAFSDNKAQKHEVTHDLSDKAKAWLGLSS
jgi:hypothetical protein